MTDYVYCKISKWTVPLIFGKLLTLLSHLFQDIVFFFGLFGFCRFWINCQLGVAKTFYRVRSALYCLGRALAGKWDNIAGMWQLDWIKRFDCITFKPSFQKTGFLYVWPKLGRFSINILINWTYFQRLDFFFRIKCSLKFFKSFCFNQVWRWFLTWTEHDFS